MYTFNTHTHIHTMYITLIITYASMEFVSLFLLRVVELTKFLTIHGKARENVTIKYQTFNSQTHVKNVEMPPLKEERKKVFPKSLSNRRALIIVAK